MKTIASIAFAWIFFLSWGHAYLTPIPKSKHTFKEACELVMEEFSKAARDYPPRWRDEAFPRFIVYTNFDNSRELQEWIPKEERNTVEKSDEAWLLSEWGWLVTVVMAHDLSQTYTYFVRASGKVELLWETD